MVVESAVARRSRTSAEGFFTPASSFSNSHRYVLEIRALDASSSKVISFDSRSSRIRVASGIGIGLNRLGIRLYQDTPFVRYGKILLPPQLTTPRLDDMFVIVERI